MRRSQRNIEDKDRKKGSRKTATFFSYEKTNKLFECSL